MVAPQQGQMARFHPWDDTAPPPTAGSRGRSPGGAPRAVTEETGRRAPSGPHSSGASDAAEPTAFLDERSENNARVFIAGTKPGRAAAGPLRSSSWGRQSHCLFPHFTLYLDRHSWRNTIIWFSVAFNKDAAWQKLTTIRDFWLWDKNIIGAYQLHLKKRNNNKKTTNH